MSFTRAAEELHVTPGAISRQIRTLEDILGFALFDRNHREVRLSAESKAYVASLSDSFRQMERATRRLVDQHREEPLHIHAAITFTLRWLVPRLNAFHARHPKQQIRLSTALPDADELAASNDVSLRLGPFGDPAGTSPALTNHYLFDIDLVPVCSPSLLRQGALDTDPQAFAGHTLLRSHARPHAPTRPRWKGSASPWACTSWLRPMCWQAGWSSRTATAIPPIQVFTLCMPPAPRRPGALRISGTGWSRSPRRGAR